jgi:uridine kinase
VLRRLAARIPRLERPVLVVVDGADGSGKTVLADELAPLVPTAVRASLDDFHHPRAHRHALGRTGRTVWERGFDHAAIRRELLDPWRHGVGSSYRSRWHDVVTDALVDPAEDPPTPVPDGGVLVVDGVFAQRPELADAWDLVVYLDVPDDVRISRMAARDRVSPDPEHPDQKRYLDAQRFYESCTPRDSADVVVDNTDPDHPIIVRETHSEVLMQIPRRHRRHGTMGR